MKRRSKRLVLEGSWSIEDELFDTWVAGIPVRLYWDHVLLQFTEAGPHVKVCVRVSNMDADAGDRVELGFYGVYPGTIIDAACEALQPTKGDLRVVIWATWQEEA